ncbi:MAG: phosphocarrier protein HPr [Clostridia bacterium BRH_c25]|nr:MAG: phosphocarrier protein HPr [Clostridia bacterium BRH_c25]
MYSRDIVVQNKTGLHARPASNFVSMALKFKSDITVTKDSKKVSAKSIMYVLSLGASKGSSITITAEGPDEEAAVLALCDLINSRFGEE